LTESSIFGELVAILNKIANKSISIDNLNSWLNDRYQFAVFVFDGELTLHDNLTEQDLLLNFTDEPMQAQIDLKKGRESSKNEDKIKKRDNFVRSFLMVLYFRLKGLINLIIAQGRLIIRFFYSLRLLL